VACRVGTCQTAGRKKEDNPMRSLRSRLLVSVALWALAAPAALAEGGRVVRIEGTVIRGKIQKPEVMMLITRQNLNTTYRLELRESFLPKVIESVNDKPF
jgi:hypothetical protein